jgi:hypothetical protein
MWLKKPPPDGKRLSASSEAQFEIKERRYRQTIQQQQRAPLYLRFQNTTVSTGIVSLIVGGA